MEIFLEEIKMIERKRRRLGLSEVTEVHQHDVPSRLPKLPITEV